jgi:superfamily II DNA or RNA helicase
MAENLPAPLYITHDADDRPALAVGPGAGLIMAQHCLPQARETIRLASVYFSLSGYALTRQLMTGGATLRVLIGQRDGPEAHRAVLQEILADLAQCELTLAEAIEELVQRMKTGRFFIREARSYSTSYGYHCKFYLMDNATGWHGSTNFSWRGLKGSAEQASLLTSPEQIAMLARWFDESAALGHDLLADLLARLQAWLDMATPFEVYLKALAALRQLDEPPRRLQADRPTHYQQLLIARALRQITEYNGALVVAATGLGKTVLGAEIAAHCYARGLSRRCIVLGPVGNVRREWLRHLRTDRDLNVVYFSLDTLFRPDSDNEDHQVELLRQHLRSADEHTLILIDEVHTYRNQWLREAVRTASSRVFERLVPAVHQQGARVLLLTATVYGTDFGNLKSLLHLLPLQPAAEGQPRREWDTRTAAQFAALPVVTILGIPHVLQLARERGDIDEQGRVFVEFNQTRCYLPPELYLYALRYRLPLQDAMQRALDEERFASTTLILHSYFGEQMQLEKGTANSIYNETIESWLSSPPALAHCLVRNIATPGYRDPVSAQPPAAGEALPYQYHMKQKRTTRQQVLRPLLNAIQLPDFAQDEKFLLLQTIVQRVCLTKNTTSTSKVLVFVNRWATALYLVEGLTQGFTGVLRVASTVTTAVNGTPELLPPPERARLLRDFAPVAHKRPAGTGPDYHVLICTDADGKGVNLQDADTLVHYDLPTAADELYQRVGRLLRLTPNPERQIAIYTLEPALAYAQQGELLRVASKSQLAIETLITRLQRRHDHSQRIMATAVRTTREQAQEPLENPTAIITTDLMADPVFEAATDAPAQAELRHLSALARYRDRINELADSLLSARSYAETQARIIVLLHTAGQHHLIRYNLKTKKLETSGEATLLEQLACQSDTERAAVPVALVELSANEAAQAWCQEYGVALTDVVKVCALYLDPHRMLRKGAARLLASDV